MSSEFERGVRACAKWYDQFGWELHMMNVSDEMVRTVLREDVPEPPADAEVAQAAHDAGMQALKRRGRPMIPSGDMSAIVRAVLEARQRSAAAKEQG